MEFQEPISYISLHRVHEVNLVLKVDLEVKENEVQVDQLVQLVALVRLVRQDPLGSGAQSVKRVNLDCKVYICCNLNTLCIRHAYSV